jgi:hypothetical protein
MAAFSIGRANREWPPVCTITLREQKANEHATNNSSQLLRRDVGLGRQREFFVEKTELEWTEEEKKFTCSIRSAKGQ